MKKKGINTLPIFSVIISVPSPSHQQQYNTENENTTYTFR